MKIPLNLPLLILTSLTYVQCNGQAEGPPVGQVEKILKEGGSVSSVLTDPAYMNLHPTTSFRELIKKYADSSAVDISPAGEPGKRIRVLVTVNDESGNPVSDALVYFYQTDAKGWYSANSPHVGGSEGDTRQARLFGYARSNGRGQFEIHTVKPSGYPQSDLPAHIHIHFEKPGFRNYVTELLFDDDERLVGPVRQQSIQYRFAVAKPENPPTGFDQQFSYSLVWRK